MCYCYGSDCLCNYKLRRFASMQKLFIRDNNANLLLCVHVFGLCSHKDTFQRLHKMKPWLEKPGNQIRR